MAIKQVRVQINGTWTTLSLNPSTGKYEATIAAPPITSFGLSGGYYPVVVEASDMAGNITTKTHTDSTLGESLKLKVKEVTKPVITILSPSPGSFLTNGTVAIKAQLRDESNGSGIAIGTLKLVLNGTTYTNTSPGMTVTQVTGGYDITFTKSLSDGIYDAYIDVSDNDGNAAARRAVGFTVDTVPPTLTITNPTDSTTYTNVNTIVVSGKTTDTTSGNVLVTITNGSDLYKGILPDGSGNFSESINLRAGTNTIVIRATDAAGKFSEVTRTVILDTVAPTVKAVTIAPNPVNTGASFTISIDASDV